MSWREGSGLWAEFLKLASLVTPSLQTRLIKSRNPATAGPYSLPPGPGASGSVTIELLHKRTAGNGKDFIVGTLPLSIVPVHTG